MRLEKDVGALITPSVLIELHLYVGDWHTGRYVENLRLRGELSVLCHGGEYLQPSGEPEER